MAHDPSNPNRDPDCPPTPEKLTWKDVLDEKLWGHIDIKEAAAAQSDLVEPVHILTAKVCLKGPSPKRK